MFFIHFFRYILEYLSNQQKSCQSKSSDNLETIWNILKSQVFATCKDNRENKRKRGINLLTFGHQAHKMAKHTQVILRMLPTNCLSEFDQIVRLALEGLNPFSKLDTNKLGSYIGKFILMQT